MLPSVPQIYAFESAKLYLFSHSVIPSLSEAQQNGEESATFVSSRLSRFLLVVSLGEEAFDEGFGVEGGEVVGLFAGADEEDGDVEFVADGEDYAALG